ncbi:hypothetical protein CBR_g9192 [Chara braunii]|uniref:Uncharacterized protein n=1 Tax=Chara braunii TaxID=69332 RepID=A0A388KPC1_CHABU|nr:hypothetical protein CBR_g9192 [Chara braunii]|eukprot:GBG71783.1 hypothetical protein CBR_g9192 [Chara braunii]
MFCWQCLAHMTDVEKLSILDDILALRGVFVQSAGGHLKRQHKLGIKDMVVTRKVDRLMLRLFHYVLFFETEEDEGVCRYGSRFFQTEGRLLEEFGPQGLMKQVWVELRKHFQGAKAYVNTCERSLPHEKESLDDTKKMYEDDSFLKDMARLCLHHVRTGKWVCYAQKQVTFREGNMLVEECDRLYVIFNGENLAGNTVAVYPASSPTKASRAHGPNPAKHAVAARSKAVCSLDPSGQVMACFDMVDEDRFPHSLWEDGGVTSARGPAYGEREWNPSHLLGLLENFCRVGQTVFFFRKAHASVMWKLVLNGRNVVALENEANMIDYLNEFMKTRVADTRNDFTFVQTTGKRNWDPKRDMHWKLSGSKRTEVWDFLFQNGPPAQTDLEYSRRRNLVFGVLNGYHDAPRESVSDFLKRLEHVYFLMAEPLTLENYKALFDEEDPFDVEDMEELSDSKTFDFEFMPLPRVVGQSRKVLESGGSECERHASEGASVDTDSESAGAPGETHALQREEETQHWPAHEVVKELDAGVLVIGTSKSVLHNRSVVAATREGVVKGGQWTFVQALILGDDEGEEEPVVEAQVHGDEKGGEPVVEGGQVTVGIQMDPQRKDDDSSPTRCVEEQGDRASIFSTGREMVVHEAIELGNNSAATELVSESGMAEVHNVESSVKGGEMAVSIKMDPERKYHDSSFTHCSEEQGDPVFVLSTGWEMVLHEAIDLPSDSTATELVSDTTRGRSAERRILHGPWRSGATGGRFPSKGARPR